MILDTATPLTLKPLISWNLSSFKKNVFRAIAWGLVVFLLSWPFFATADEEPYDEAVSLGMVCQPAWHLEGHHMRRWAYPLDWMITPFHGLLLFIQNKGAHFLEKEHLKVLEILEGTPSILHVVDEFYDIHSIHDFQAPSMQNFEKVKAKYERRIQRFFKLLASHKKVLLVRVQISRSEAETLTHLLSKLYPELNYTLVAVSEELSAKESWGLERVSNFYMPQISGHWQGDDEKWQEILCQFPVKESKKPRPPEEKW